MTHRKGMQMRKTRLLTAAAVVSTFALLATGCSDSSSDAGGTFDPPDIAAATALPAAEDSLSILAWPGYAEDGSTDPAYDWVTPFEKDTGCEVTVKTFGTSDEAVSLFQGGGYDVVSMSGDASLRLIAGGDVEPVNTDLVPNYADIFPALKDQPWNTVNGVNYGIPHGRGSNLLQYNTEKVKPAPDSWAVTFAPDGEKYKGQITAYDTPIFIADAANYLRATQPDLGIKNPYALDETQLEAAVNLLKEQNPLISEYWSDYTKQIASFKSEDTLLGFTWQINTNLAQAEDVPVEAIKPKEGATGWSDTWAIATESESQGCAYRWLDYVVSPKVNAQIAEYFGEAPANEKSCALTADKNHCDIFHAEDEAFWEDVYYWTTPIEKCLDGRTDVKCTDYSEWTQKWTEIKG
jgi:putative spermidine/putrescine transport system substrate-binding protein